MISSYCHQRQKVAWLLGVMLCLALIVCHAAWAAGSKTEELEQKIADISLVHQQFNDRAAQAESIRNTLLEQQQELVSEIAFLAKSEEIKTIGQAEDNLRIHYNLDLLGTVTAYILELEAKIQFYQTGTDKLAYLQQLATDDIKMISTLNDMRIDALTTQISLVINRYLPEAHAIQIDPVRIEPVSPERIWAAYIQPR